MKAAVYHGRGDVRIEVEKTSVNVIDAAAAGACVPEVRAALAADERRPACATRNATRPKWVTRARRFISLRGAPTTTKSQWEVRGRRLRLRDAVFGPGTVKRTCRGANAA